MPRYAAAIFDLDGTLIDTESILLDAGIQALRTFGHDVSRDFLISLIGIHGPDANRRLADHLGAHVDFAALDREWSALTRRRYALGIPVMTGVHDLLGALGPLPRAVATNSSTDGAIRKLGEAGIAHHFEHVVGFDSVPRPKPSPDVFAEAARRLGITPADCVAFEDSEVGVAAALAAGMTVVHVPDLMPATSGTAHHTTATLMEGARACGLID
jgi:HAD superfamily hydrolase (TIGR01509 family)